MFAIRLLRRCFILLLLPAAVHMKTREGGKHLLSLSSGDQTQAVSVGTGKFQTLITDRQLALPATPHIGLLNRVQWTTGSRLLKLGEPIKFTFFIPAGKDAGELKIFANYLETLGDPGNTFRADGGMTWLEQRTSEAVPLKFHDGRASLTYRPRAPGNYMARWSVGADVLYRYFSVITDEYIVLRFGGYHELKTDPTLHATGIPMDFPLPIEKYTSQDSLGKLFLGYHRQFGDAVIPQFPDSPDLKQEQRIQQYAAAVDKIRTIVPDTNDLREGRIEMWHSLDPGYVSTLRALGMVSHFGLQMANGGSWLGMPEFPYFASPLDIRKINQEQGGLVTHQWDFCTGWHFLGPQSWHYSISQGNWEAAQKCLYQGVREAENCAQISGHFAYLGPLYDGNLRNTPEMFDFVERYQRYIAFDMTRQFKLVFARSIDIADYYRRHFVVTPTTVFVSKTDHLFYDMHWGNIWAGSHLLMARERLPWLTRMSSIGPTHRRAKDPLSQEYMVVEDQKRSIRFERECPNPTWWYKYTNQEEDLTSAGSKIAWTETPDVDFVSPPETNPNRVGGPPEMPTWKKDSDGMSIKLKAITKSKFTDYAIALWGLPQEFARNPNLSKIRSNVKKVLLARNTAGEYHLVVFFDLEPDLVLRVTLLGLTSTN